VGWVYEYALVDRSGTHTLADLRSFQDWYLRYWLEAVHGVAEVASVAARQQYQVEIIPPRSSPTTCRFTRSRTPSAARTTRSAAAFVEFNGTEYMVSGRGYVKSVDDIKKIAVGTNGSGTPILVRDIGQVHLGPDLRRGLVELDGEERPSVALLSCGTARMPCT